MIVIDSSALADYLAGTPQARWVETQLDSAAWQLHAPHLLDVEVVSAFRKLAVAGSLPPRRARTLLATMAELPIVRYPHVQLLDRMWELKAHVSAQDATFVALAGALALPLVTTDLRLARAHGLRVTIVAP